MHQNTERARQLQADELLDQVLEDERAEALREFREREEITDTVEQVARAVTIS